MNPIPVAILLVGLAASAPAQEKSAPFDAPLVTLPMTDRYELLVDLDHDGFMDAVSWWWTSGYTRLVRLTGWRNNGHGKFVQAWSKLVDLGSDLPARSSRLILRSCNVDSDGSTDFAFELTAYQWASIRVLRSHGLEAPELVPAYSLSWIIQGAPPDIHSVVADFTGDGQADLAYTLFGSLHLLEYVPGQPSLQLRSQTSPLLSIEGLMPLDANGDATPDLLLWKGTTVKMIAVQDCRPTATFTFLQGITDHHMPAAGDIDGDGDEDLVIWDMSRYVVLRRDGAASWTVEPPVTGGPAEFLVDVDQDGDLDGVCCGGGGGEDPLYNLLPSTMRVSVNDGTGSFAPAIETSWLGSDHLAGIADLDHDGDLDVVAGRCILYARGPLTEVLRPPLGGSAATERSTADFDGDSDPDFEVGMRTMERNLGEGACTEYEASFPPATPAGTVFVGPGWPGDWDGDGDVDLVVKHYAGSTLLEQRLLVNLGGGTFADGGPAGPNGVDFNPNVHNGDVPEASLAADADGDGDLDLITRSYAPTSVPRSRVWWNGGAGTFIAGPEYPDECIHQVADLTGDGIPDLVGVTNTVGWQAGLGGGAFGARVELETLDPHRDRFALADLDADGDLDFAIVTKKPWLQMYWNDGTGGFTNEQETAVGFLANLQPPRRVWSADVDGDGLLDLLITPATRETNGVRILERRADNSGWQEPFSQIVFEHSGTGGILLDAVLRDVDGDGDLDFLTDRLTRNSTHVTPQGGRRLQLETGTPGTGGIVPTLGAEGPFRVGESAELRIRGGVGGASGVLTAFELDDTGPPRSAEREYGAPLQGELFRIPFTLSGTPGTPGAGSWTLPYTVPWSALGHTRRYIATLSDPGAPGGVARTNGLLLSYGL